MIIKKWLLIFIITSMVVLPMIGCISETTTPITALGNLQFQVKDTSQNALQGAKVVSDSQPDGQLKVTGITDINGIVTFNNIAAGEYKFYISRFDFFPTEVTLTVVTGQTLAININLTPETNPTTIPTTVSKITITDLSSQPEIYNDQFIAIDGYWFDGFEIVVLAERLEPSSFATGNVQPRGILIWIKGGLSEEVSQQLYLQSNNPTGYPAHYGKVELTGQLEYGGKYGHLNSYVFQLTVYESRLLNWTPANG